MASLGKTIKLWRVDFTGHYLGGIAIAVAPTVEEAREAVAKQNPELAGEIAAGVIVELMLPLLTSVIYCDDGNY